MFRRVLHTSRQQYSSIPNIDVFHLLINHHIISLYFFDCSNIFLVAFFPLLIQKLSSNLNTFYINNIRWKFQYWPVTGSEFLTQEIQHND